MRRTYDATGVDPSTISLIEAHGTGIRLGDRTEVGAMKEIFGPRQGVEGHIAVGSVKSMISHTIPAAGIASIIKTSMALHHKTLPPSLCEEVEPSLGITDTALYVNTSPRPWIHTEKAPRRAGVNAFGFGGVNAHTILEEAPEAALRPPKSSPLPAEVCVFAADSAEALTAQLDRLAAFLEARADATLADITHTLWQEAGQGPHRLSITAKDSADLAKKLGQARKKLAKSGRFVTRTGVAASDAPLGGKLAFMFPGEGSQYLYMLADLAQHFPGVRRWLDFWLDMGEGDTPRTDIVYPRESEMTDDKRSALREQLFSMAVGSEASFVAGQAMFACLTDLGVTPDAMVGHSSGENAALLAAGIVRASSAEELGEGFRKITRISRDIEAEGNVPTGALIAVGLIDVTAINAAIAGTSAMIAMENCQQQTILFASHAEAEAVIAALTKAGGVCEVLPFDRGYHTPAFQPMQDAFEAFYTDIGVHAPTVPLYSCASAGLFPDDARQVCALAAAQWSQKVRFIDTLRAMHSDGIRAFVEVGAGGKLSAFADQILANEKADGLLISSSNMDGACGIASLMQLMGQLFVSGHADVAKLFEGRAIDPLDLDVLKTPKPKGMFLDNSIPKIAATPELTAFLHGLMGQTASLPPAQSTPQTAPQNDAAYPFLSAITREGDRLTAQVALDATRDLYLQDHILSGPVSEDPDLMGLPCVPLMASLEIMAEAAAALMGRRDLGLIENLQGSRWLTVESAQATLSVQATRVGETSADVEIWADGSKAVQVRLTFGHLTPPAEALPQVIPEAEYCAPGAYETYAEHIFHGPVFQSIEYVTAWSPTGIEATLSDVTLDGFFRAGETPELILNPVLFDALTQLSAFWLAQEIGLR